MNPEDVVLVALLKNLSDLELAARDHWYRIPVRHAPRFFSGAQYLAFYLGTAFGDRKWSIQDYAEVRGHELARRLDLFPAEPHHPRAEELYYKLQIGNLKLRDRPIRSKRGRRILFLWTTWEKFSSAREFNDLFQRGRARDRLWSSLQACGLDVEREILAREGRSRYRVDFMIYCRLGRLAVQIDPFRALPPSTGRFQKMAISGSDLDNNFDRTVEAIQFRARDLNP